MRSIITRVVAAVLTVITAFSVALVYNAGAQRQVVAELARINQGYVPLARQLDDLAGELRSFSRALTSRDPAALRQSLRASMALFPISERVEAHLDTLRLHLEGMLADELGNEERAFVSNVSSVIEVLSVECAEIGVLVDELLLGLDEAPPRLEPTYGELGSRLIALEKRVDDLGGLVDDRTDDAVTRIRASERDILVRVVGVSALAALFALAAVFVIGRSLHPIRQLTAMATRLKEGDYRAEPVAAGNDEIGVLASEFAGMAEAIRERDAALRSQKAELETAYRALVEAQRAQVQAERLAAVGELSARVTHELRNPLSSIGLNAEMLAEELASRGEELGDAQEMLRAIEREVARLTELTERYLSMARSDDPRREPVDLGDLARDVVAQRAAEHARAGLEVQVDAPNAVVASVDEPQIRQVLINLLRNAAQAMAERSGDRRILVAVREDGGLAVLRVEDSGPGVDPDRAEAVFEAFVTGRPDGTGLGLSISRQIARRHGGELSVGPAPRLGGAAFEMRLPRLAGRAESVEQL